MCQIYTKFHQNWWCGFWEKWTDRTNFCGFIYRIGPIFPVSEPKAFTFVIFRIYICNHFSRMIGCRVSIAFCIFFRQGTWIKRYIMRKYVSPEWVWNSYPEWNSFFRIRFLKEVRWFLGKDTFSTSLRIFWINYLISNDDSF